MFYEATEPQRVIEKFEECRHRLVEMADSERALDTEKFKYALAGFLYAFRSAAYRLIGVVRNGKGPVAGRDLRDKLWAHGSIGFLKDRSDLETHGNGPVIWQRYIVDVSSVMCGRWERKHGRFADRYNRSRYESPSVEVTRSTQAIDWQFANRPENLIALCHDALTALEEFYRQDLASAPSPTSPTAATASTPALV